MSAAVMGLAVGYVLLAAVLVVMCLATRYHWLLKAVLVVAVSALYVVNAKSLKGLLGWPITDPLPSAFRLLSAQVYEPDKLTDSKGVIYFWLVPTETRVGWSRPRAYEMPYDAELHAKIVKAKSQMQNGVPQLGQVGEASGMIDPQAPGKVDLSIDFYDMPSGALPDK